MIVNVSYTVDVPDNIRRGIRMHYGEDGLATRQEVKDWYRSYGVSADDDLSWSVQLEDEARQ